MKNIVSSGGVVMSMTPHHKTYAVEWSLMVQETAIPAPGRIFDIFGDADPGK
jgi:hypothetical protein